MEALSGGRAWNFIAESMNHLSDVSSLLKVKPADLRLQIEKLQEQLKQKDKLLQSREEELAVLRASALKPERIGNIDFIGGQIPAISADGLKAAAERARNNKISSTIVLLASAVAPDKVSVVAGVSDDLVRAGYNAGSLVREFAVVCGGGGGGKPQLAEAGGKDPSKIAEAISRVKQILLEKSGAN